MTKLWNVGNGNGDDRGVLTVKRRDYDGKVKDFVRIPPMFSGCVCGPSGANGRVDHWDGTCRCGREKYIEHKPGNVYLSLPGHSFYCIPKGASFDPPFDVPVKALKSMCPQLVTQEEFESQQDAAPPVVDEPKTEAKPKK